MTRTSKLIAALLGLLAVGGAYAAGADMGKEQAMVDDDDLGVAQPGAGPLVETVFTAAVLVAAGGGVGVDCVPDFR